MKKYIAFLRGINISGKNKIIMSELKSAFEELGYSEVKTYLNSGNVIFSSDIENENKTGKIETMIEQKFNIIVPVLVVSRDDLEDVLLNSPEWWGTDDKEIYDNIIFLIPPTSYEEVFNEIGEPREGLEQIQDYKNVIFWSFNRKDYQKTNWWSKTASVSISSQITIRTANTVRKIAGML